MKQSILIYSYDLEHTESAYNDLTKQDISVTVVTNRLDAFSALISSIPDFLWIDLNPDAARIFLTEIMDQFLHPPPYIILTSSFTGSTDRAELLDHGADACVEMPVDLCEILAILNAVLRREEKLRYGDTTNLSPLIAYKDLLIDPSQHMVKMRGRIVTLTLKEFDILYLLATNPGIVFTKEQIYTHIWKETASVGAAIVFDHISSLRKKLRLPPRDTEYIQTVYKVGYRFAGAG